MKALLRLLNGKNSRKTPEYVTQETVLSRQVKDYFADLHHTFKLWFLWLHIELALHNL